MASTSEPWIALPLLGGLQAGLSQSAWHQRIQEQAIQDLCDQVVGGRRSVELAVGKALHEVYSNLAGNSPIFLDKTPRYSLILPSLRRALPDSTFVLLWRHPLAVASSIIKTWGGGHWNVNRFHVDFHQGLRNMLSAREASSPNLYNLKFEDLVKDPDGQLKSLCSILNIEYKEEMSQRFSDIRLRGTLGDQRGTALYRTLEPSRGEGVTWPEEFGSLWRRRLARRFWSRLPKGLDELGYGLPGKEDRAGRLGAIQAITDFPHLAANSLSSRVDPSVAWWLDDKIRRLALGGADARDSHSQV